LDAAAGYTGTIDLSTFNLTSATGGDITFAHSTLTFGTGTIWLDSGTLDWTGVGTFNATVGQKFRFTGTCVVNPQQYLYGGGLTVDASADVTVNDRLDYRSGTVSISGLYTQNSPNTTQWGNDADIAINVGGELEYTGTGSFYIISCSAGHGFTAMDGTITGPGKYIYLANWASGANALPASTNYNVSFYMWCTSVATADAYFTLEVGDYAVENLLCYNDGAFDLFVDFTAATSITTSSHLNLYAYSTGACNVDNSGATNLFIGGSMREYGTGTRSWTKGTGTITFDGGSLDSYLDMPSSSLEDIVADKSSSKFLTLLGSTNCESLTFTNGGLNNSNQDITVGNVTFGAGTTACIYGTGTWSVSGSFDSSASTVAPAYTNTNFIFSGSGQTIANSTQHDNWWNVTITGTYTFTGTSTFYAWNSLTMTNGSSFDLNGGHLYIRGTSDIAGTITYSGVSGWVVYLVANDSNNNPTTTGVTGSGAINAYNIYFYPLVSGSQLRVGTYSPANNFFVYQNTANNYVWQPSAGTYSFSCVRFYMYCNSTGNLTIDCTNNPTFEFDCNVQSYEAAASSGLLTFTNYTGALYKIIGSIAAQYLVDVTRAGGLTHPPLEINRGTGYAYLSSNWTCQSFLLTAGEFRTNGLDLDTVGDFTILPGGDLQDANLPGSTITVGGDFDVAGSVGTPLDITAASVWYLNVSGSGVATYTNVSYSDANGGNPIIANDGTNTNSGNNFNWIFPSASISISPSMSISVSPSMSVSVSPSVSLSHSPSISFSHSPSVSFSHSPSVSVSYSPSVSFSHSPSISVSPSISLSLSPSPSLSTSIGPAEITKFATEVLGYAGASSGASGAALPDVRVIVEDLLGGDGGSDDWDYSGWVS